MVSKDKQGYRVGKYIIGKKLGEGGFGTVRSALNSETNERVAIKILDKGQIKDMQMVAQVRNEISLLTTLKHPHIVGGIEVLSSSTRLFLVMEYVDGGDMHALVVRKRRLPAYDACRYFKSLLCALHYCHSRGVSHRDLKLENLLLTRENPPKVRVCDFGLANIRSLSSASSNLCETIVGTEDYSAPEVILGKPYDGKKADMWSAGVLLYTMVAGYCPFRGADTQGIFESVVNCRYSFPKQFPRELQSVISKLLVVDPSMRPSAEAILQSEWASPSSKSTDCSSKNSSHGSTNLEEFALSPVSDQGSSSNSSVTNLSSDQCRNVGSTRIPTSPLSISNSRFSSPGSIFDTRSPKRSPVHGFGTEKALRVLSMSHERNTQLQSTVLPKFSELYLAMREESHGIAVTDRRYRLRVYRKCFIGSEAVTWIVKNRRCSRLEAVNLGQQLMDANIFNHVCEDHAFKDDYLFYRFREDDPGNSKVLNRRLTWPKFDYGRRAIAISVELLTEMMDICRKYQACDSSREIDFVGLQLDERYSAFRNATAELQAVKLGEISDEQEKVAFVINCHNMLWMHARVELGPATESASETVYFVMIRKLQYDIGGVTFSLEDFRTMCSSGRDKNSNRPLSTVFTVAQSSSNFTRTPNHFWRHLLHPTVDDTDVIMRSPQLWHPFVVFALSDASRGSPPIVPLTSDDVTVVGLRIIAMRHIEMHLSDLECANFSTFHAFLAGLPCQDSEYSIAELLHCIDQIVSERKVEIITWRVLELKQLLKGGTIRHGFSTSSANCSSFAPAL